MFREIERTDTVIERVLSRDEPAINPVTRRAARAAMERAIDLQNRAKHNARTDNYRLALEQTQRAARIALLGDPMEGVNAHGKAIAAELRVLEADFSSDRADASGEATMVVQEKLDVMIEAADAIATAESLETARDGFYALTKPMVLWREGASRSDRPAVAYCPMHKRSWLQPGDEIGNPYGGMPGCGSIVSK